MLRFLLLILTSVVGASAQFSYRFDQSIPVVIDGKSLSMPWAGGLNSAQINTADLNNDGKEDLVVFDRAANRLFTYLNVDGKYVYAPEYEQLFPTGISHWLLLRDYNCDGKKDIFTSDPFGMKAYQNVTPAGGMLEWKVVEFFSAPGIPKSDIVLTEGFSGNINLKINESDIPAIDDIDGDGDLDILNMRFVGVGTIEYNKNLSMELYGNCDSLKLKRVTQTFGGVEECTCGQFAFGGVPCPGTAGGRTQHVGGKTLLTIDLNNDGARELLFAEESCTSLYMLGNTGTSEGAAFSSVNNFPSSTPVSFQMFPASFSEDVDFDGLADLIVSPNLYQRTNTNVLVDHSVHYYKNTGTSETPAFTFIRDNFLQNEMIEMGDYSVPAFLDIDGDGDEDMLVGFYANNLFRGSLYHFENTGSKQQPSFELVTRDFASLSFLSNYNFKPQTTDINNDGKIDLVFTSTSTQNGITSLQYFLNTAANGFGFTDYVITSFKIGVSENVAVVDVNQDGLVDILYGRSTGALQYWENGGSPVLFDNMTLVNGSYLGLGPTPSRQNPAVAFADLDADGFGDLIVANNRGILSIYGDFRNFDSGVLQPASSIVYNELTDSYVSPNLGGRIWPTVVNLFNSDKPTIVAGNTTGGLHILRNDGGLDLPPDPVITLFPNPLPQGEDLKIKADRNVVVQIYSVLGQKMSEPFFVQANQAYPLKLQYLASGMYIARFTTNRKNYSQRFVLK